MENKEYIKQELIDIRGEFKRFEHVSKDERDWVLAGYIDKLQVRMNTFYPLLAIADNGEGKYWIYDISNGETIKVNDDNFIGSLEMAKFYVTSKLECFKTKENKND